MTPARKPLEHVPVARAAELLGISASNMRRYCAEGRVLNPRTRRRITKTATPMGSMWMVPLDPRTGRPVVTLPASGLRRGARCFPVRPPTAAQVREARQVPAEPEPQPAPAEDHPHGLTDGQWRQLRALHEHHATGAQRPPVHLGHVRKLIERGLVRDKHGDALDTGARHPSLYPLTPQGRALMPPTPAR